MTMTAEAGVHRERGRTSPRVLLQDVTLRPNGHLLLYTFLLLFGPKLGWLDVLSFTAVVIVVHAAFVGVPSPPRSLIAAVLFLSGIAAYSGAVYVLHPGAELAVTVRIFRAILNLIAAYSLVCLFRRQYGTAFAGKILEHLFLAVALHGVIMIAEVASPGFRSFVYGYTGFTKVTGWRVPGLTISFGNTAITHGFALMAAPVLGSRVRGVGTSILFAVSTLVVFASLFLAGRLGFYMMSGFTLVSLLFVGHRLIRRPAAIAGIGLAAVLGALLLTSLTPVTAATFRTYTLGHLLEPWKAYELTGRFDARSLRHVSTMYFVPEDDRVFLFGEGITGRGDVYVRSDVGFVLSLYGIGLVGTCMVTFFYFHVMRSAWLSRRYDPALALLAGAFAIAVVVLNCKENAFLTRHGFTVTSMMLATYYLLRAEQSSRVVERG